MSNRSSYALVVILLLIAAVLRLISLSTLPPGFQAEEIDNIRIIETARQGRIEVFYDLRGEGHEGLYGVIAAAITTMTGSGLVGYRILPVMSGLLTLALIYTLGKRLFGAPTGLAATALLAFNLWHVILSRTVGSEVVLPLFVTAVLLALARALPIDGARPSHTAHEPNTTPFAALGVLLGLGFYLHPANFFIVIFSMLFIIYMVFFGRGMTRRIFSFLWFAIVVLIVLATPYLLSSLQLPALNATRRVFDSNIGNPLQSFVSALGGVFFIGDDNPARNVPGRPMIDLVSGLLLVLGLLTALRSWRQPRFMLVLLALVLFAPPALLAANSPNFLNFAPLLPLIALLFGLGLITLLRSFSRPARRVGVVFAVGLFVFNLAWTGRDLLITWRNSPDTQTAFRGRIGLIAHHLDLTAGTIPTVVCTSEMRPQAAPRELSRPQILALMMHRQDANLRLADCGSALILANGGEHTQVVLLDRAGLSTVHPYLRNWLARGVPVRAGDLPADSVFELRVAQPLADTVGAFTTTAPVSYAPEAPRGNGVAAPPLRFGGNITFLGDERDWQGRYPPNGVVEIITYWRVDGVVPPDLRFFTHIQADPAAIPVAQNDTIGVLPEQLQPRDVIIQVTFIQLPVSIPAGAYSVSTGAYEANTGTRLTVFDGETPRGTRLFLGALTVSGG